MACIINTCKGFRPRVETVIAADGGYIESAVGEGMWLVVPGHCFTLLLVIYEPIIFISEMLKSARTFGTPCNAKGYTAGPDAGSRDECWRWA